MTNLTILVIGLVTNQARRVPVIITEVPPRLHPEATVTDLGTAWHDAPLRSDRPRIRYVYPLVTPDGSIRKDFTTLTNSADFSRADLEYVAFLRSWLQRESIQRVLTILLNSTTSLRPTSNALCSSACDYSEESRDLTTLIAWWSLPTSLGPIQSTLRFSARDLRWKYPEGLHYPDELCRPLWTSLSSGWRWDTLSQYFSEQPPRWTLSDSTPLSFTRDLTTTGVSTPRRL